MNIGTGSRLLALSHKCLPPEGSGEAVLIFGGFAKKCLSGVYPFFDKQRGLRPMFTRVKCVLESVFVPSEGFVAGCGLTPTVPRSQGAMATY